MAPTSYSLFFIWDDISFVERSSSFCGRRRGRRQRGASGDFVNLEDLPAQSSKMLIGSTRKLPSVNGAGGNDVPGRCRQLVGLALHDVAGNQVDGEEVLVEEEVDDGGVHGVDEREHGELHGQTGGLVALIGPDVAKPGLVLQRPLRGVGIEQRPHADLERAAGVAVPVHVDEAQLAGADPHVAVPVEHARSPPVPEHLARRERDEGQGRRVDGGVAGDEAEGEVNPPEPAVVREHAGGPPQPGRDRVADVLHDPLADVGGEAEEDGAGAAADDGLELGDDVVAAAAGGEHDPDGVLVGEELGVGERERGRGRGVEDEVVGLELAPAALLVAAAADAVGPRGAALVGVEEEEARGVGGEDGGAVVGGGGYGVQEDARRDGEEGDAWG
ncbi:hypothetical protein EJB05_07527, partial [Eragrostis curvula]